MDPVLECRVLRRQRYAPPAIPSVVARNLATAVGAFDDAGQTQADAAEHIGISHRSSLRGNPPLALKIDASFIAAHRLTRDDLPTGHCEIVPDLAVEVISPNDLYSDVETKVDEYLQAGVRLVWVIDPGTESVRVHRLNGSVQDLSSRDPLSGEDVVPGFSCPVAKLFELPA